MSAERQEAQRREQFLSKAAKLYDEQMLSRRGGARVGPEHAGSGESFDDIEQQAMAAGRQLSRMLMEDRLAAQEQALPEQVRCAGCGRPMRRSPNGMPRNLDTCSGTVRYRRRHAVCDRCRASFSPSGPPAGDSAPGPLEPESPQDL